MIFVIAGTNKRPFDRLMQAVDRIASEKKRYDFVIQRGYSTYSPQHCRYFDFCKGEEFLSYIRSTDLVISHAGFGSIGHCVRHNKPVILVPREYKYGEAVDKQYELAEYMAAEHDSIFCIRDVSLLSDAIEQLIGVKTVYHHHNCVFELISTFIKENFYDKEM